MGVQALLNGHEETVTAVRILPWEGGSVIASGSADRTIRIWESSNRSLIGFHCAVVLRGHRGSINCLAVRAGHSLIVSGAADATVRVWRIGRSGKAVEGVLLQVIRSSSRTFPLTVALHAHGSPTCLFLAVAGTKQDVLIYASDSAEDSLEFNDVATLTGHEAWIRSLDFAGDSGDPKSDLFLASASQDRYIRIWRIGKTKSNVHPKAPGPPNGPGRPHGGLVASKNVGFCVAGRSYVAGFEALLSGHEDWVQSVSWNTGASGKRLLSASADNSLSIWEPDATSGTWACTSRLGDVSAQKGATTATGSFGGLWLGLWGPSGTSLAALGRTGSWRRWNQSLPDERWIQSAAITGHFKGVTGLAWAKEGEYLLSTSLDQTTRVHACMRQGARQTWHEISRAQIHGYDINCIDSLKADMFVSGADEKLLRVFTKPRSTALLLGEFSGTEVRGLSHLPSAATMPTLGLSSKTMDPVSGLNGFDTAVSAPSASTPVHKGIQAEMTSVLLPTEDDLARNTLWPEIEKLYGHGCEIAAVTASHNGKVIASACKSSSLEHSVIRLYETESWREIKPSLSAHTLTVNCLKFSQDDRYLLSVGRDRQHTVFERDETSNVTYRALSVHPKSHSRMILGAAWAPLGHRTVFATAGRDKLIKIWELAGGSSQVRTSISTSDAVRSIEFHPRASHIGLLLACGTESGEVSVYCIASSSLSVHWNKALVLRSDKCIFILHALTMLADRRSPLRRPRLHGNLFHLPTFNTKRPGHYA